MALGSNAHHGHVLSDCFQESSLIPPSPHHPYSVKPQRLSVLIMNGFHSHPSNPTQHLSSDNQHFCHDFRSSSWRASLLQSWLFLLPILCTVAVVFLIKCELLPLFRSYPLSSASPKSHTQALHNLVLIPAYLSGLSSHLQTSSPPLALQHQSTLNLQLHVIICSSQDTLFWVFACVILSPTSSLDQFYVSITIQLKQYVRCSLS